MYRLHFANALVHWWTLGCFHLWAVMNTPVIMDVHLQCCTTFPSVYFRTNFIIPEREFCALRQSLPLPPSPASGNHWSAFCLSEVAAHKWDHAYVTLCVWLLSLSSMFQGSDSGSRTLQWLCWRLLRADLMVRYSGNLRAFYLTVESLKRVVVGVIYPIDIGKCYTHQYGLGGFIWDSVCRHCFRASP